MTQLALQMVTSYFQSLCFTGKDPGKAPVPPFIYTEWIQTNHVKYAQIMSNVQGLFTYLRHLSPAALLPEFCFLSSFLAIDQATEHDSEYSVQWLHRDCKWCSLYKFTQQIVEPHFDPSSQVPTQAALLRSQKKKYELTSSTMVR